MRVSYQLLLMFETLILSSIKMWRPQLRKRLIKVFFIYWCYLRTNLLSRLKVACFQCPQAFLNLFFVLFCFVFFCLAVYLNASRFYIRPWTECPDKLNVSRIKTAIPFKSQCSQLSGNNMNRFPPDSVHASLHVHM